MSTSQTFISSVIPPADRTWPAWWFAFRGIRLLTKVNESSASVPQVVDLRDLGLEPLSWQYLGLLDGRHCYSAELDGETEPPEGWTFHGLRRLYSLLPEPQFLLAGRAVQIVDWDRTHRFCGRCGTHTQDKKHERAKECPNCGLISYPRISPAIIVLIERDDGRLLLARAHRHPPGFYSVLAGFVEPGETLEEAVVREIREEVGIEVENIQYYGSQPWPFPNSLMIAFTCSYIGGEIRLEEEELEDAGWYTADDLPRVPPKLSIARQMIDYFVAKQTL